MPDIAPQRSSQVFRQKLPALIAYNVSSISKIRLSYEQQVGKGADLFDHGPPADAVH